MKNSLLLFICLIFSITAHAQSLQIGLGGKKYNLDFKSQGETWETTLPLFGKIVFTGTLSTTGKTSLLASLPNLPKKLVDKIFSPFINQGSSVIEISHRLIVEIKTAPGHEEVELNVKLPLKLKLDPTREKIAFVLSVNPFTQELGGELAENETWNFLRTGATIKQGSISGTLKGSVVKDISFSFSLTIPGLGEATYQTNIDAEKPQDFLLNIQIKPSLQASIKEKASKLDSPVKDILEAALNTLELKEISLKTSFEELINNKTPQGILDFSIRLFGLHKNLKLDTLSLSSTSGAHLSKEIVSKLKKIIEAELGNLGKILVNGAKAALDAGEKVTQAVGKHGEAYLKTTSEKIQQGTKALGKAFQEGWEDFSNTISSLSGSSKTTAAKSTTCITTRGVKIHLANFFENLAVEVEEKYMSQIYDFLKETQSKLTALNPQEQKIILEARWQDYQIQLAKNINALSIQKPLDLGYFWPSDACSKISLEIFNEFQKEEQTIFKGILQNLNSFATYRIKTLLPGKISNKIQLQSWKNLELLSFHAPPSIFQSNHFLGKKIPPLIKAKLKYLPYLKELKFYRPIKLPIGWISLGDVLLSSKKNSLSTLIAKDDPKIFKKVADYRLLWSNEGLKDNSPPLSVWMPLAPKPREKKSPKGPGAIVNRKLPQSPFVPLGLVIQKGYNKPNLSDLRLIHKKYLTVGRNYQLIWQDHRFKRHGHYLNLWNVKDALNFHTFLLSHRQFGIPPSQKALIINPELTQLQP